MSKQREKKESISSEAEKFSEASTESFSGSSIDESLNGADDIVKESAKQDQNNNESDSKDSGDVDDNSNKVQNNKKNFEENSEGNFNEKNFNEGNFNEGNFNEEKLQNELKKFKELALRSRADYENLKKRGERQREEMKNWLIRDIATGIINALDDFDRALQTIGNPTQESEKADKLDGLVQGIELVLIKISDTLKNYGVEETGQAGEVFDPNFHEAIQMTDDPNVTGQTIGTVYQKGYKINDFSIRLAKVQVLKGKQSEKKETEKNNENKNNENVEKNEKNEDSENDK